MADMLADGASWLAGRLKAAAGRTVTYQRGAAGTDVTATIGRSQFEAQTTAGVIETWESRDYLISTADLPYGDPQRGDTIVETIGDDVNTYDVTSPRGIPVFHTDAFRTVVRVHTKLSETAVRYVATEGGDQIVTEAGDLLVA